MAKKQSNIQNVNETSGVVVDSKKKKKKKGGLITVLLILFLLILIGATVAAFMFNWFSLRQSAVDLAMSMDQGYVQETLQSAENEKAKAQENQQLAEAAKSEYEKKLAELESREKAVAEQEANLAAAQDAVLNGQTPAEKRASMISMFENMDRASAASTLQQINDVGTVAGILSEMKQKAAAEIMDQFPAEYAAAVAQAMM